MNEEKRIFLGYAREDGAKVRALYTQLLARGFWPWLDVDNLTADQDWRGEILHAVQNSKVFLACFSEHSVRSRGDTSRLFPYALSVCKDMLPESISLIPVRLDDSGIPDYGIPEFGIGFQGLQWVDLFEEDGFERLVAAIEHVLGSEPADVGETVGSSETVSELEEQKERTKRKRSQISGILPGKRSKQLKQALSASGGIVAALAILALAAGIIWELTRTTSDTEIIADMVWREGEVWRARLSDAGDVELDRVADEDGSPRRIVADIRGHRSAISAVRFVDDGRSLETIDQDGRVIVTDVDALVGLMSLPSYRTLQQAKRAAETEIGRPLGERSIAAAQSVYGWTVAALTPAPAALSAGEKFRDCKACPEMVVLPAGSFLMGSPEGVGDPDEHPQREVTIPAFAMGATEVTFDQWDACVAAGACVHQPDDAGWGRDDRPVINVSWQDTQQYAAWLSNLTGATYHLPSEAKWEYAARAGTTTAYAFGDEITDQQANFGDSVGTTDVVGGYPPNAWGLHDMHGNVWEWVRDTYQDSYVGAPADGGAWIEGENSPRVLRGGSWSGVPDGLRSADRNGNYPVNRVDTVGFRVSRTLTP
ncbi:MAG: SUMF1/EgtB/PvdO family nonheme iron enzyme [Geminicoccaceae bacterium]